LFDVPKDRKNMEYQKYLHKLLEYLDDYTQRVKPLLSLPNEMESVAKEFEQQWEVGTFPGWPVSYIFNSAYDFWTHKFPERGWQCPDQRRCAFGLVCIFFVGRTCLFGARST